MNFSICGCFEDKLYRCDYIIQRNDVSRENRRRSSFKSSRWRLDLTSTSTWTCWLEIFTKRTCVVQSWILEWIFEMLKQFIICGCSSSSRVNPLTDSSIGRTERQQDYSKTQDNWKFIHLLCKKQNTTLILHDLWLQSTSSQTHSRILSHGCKVKLIGSDL